MHKHCRRRMLATGLFMLTVGVVYFGLSRSAKQLLTFDSQWPYSFQSTDTNEEQPFSSDEVSENAASTTGVSVRVSILAFTVTSPKAHSILRDYQQRFDAALAQFNSTCNADSGQFPRSREFVALIKEFRSRGTFKFHDELRRVIPIGQHLEWGDSNSISAKRSDLDEHLTVAFAVTYGQSSAASTIVVGSTNTIVAGGLSTCSTQSLAAAIPVLADLPFVGAKLFTIPYTRTTGVDYRLLVSAALIK